MGAHRSCDLLRRARLGAALFRVYEGPAPRFQALPSPEACVVHQRLRPVSKRRPVRRGFERPWVVIELLYAQRFGLYPARCIITGPPHASDNMGSPLDVEATFAEEKITILRAILDECSVDHVAERIHEFRIFASRSGSAQSP